MKLHLGCGRVILPGYVNADIQPGPGVNLVCDARALPFADDSLDFIYSCALIEHLGRREWLGALVHWYTRLKLGGTLRLSTADFQAVCEWYLETGSLDHLLGLTVGGQRDIYDWHGMVFDYSLLAFGLRAAGFKNVRRYDWRETIVGELGIDDFSQVYMPHMDKEHGRLMVLNLEADK